MGWTAICLDCLTAAEHLQFTLLNSFLQDVTLVLDLGTHDVCGGLFTLMDALEVSFFMDFGNWCLFFGL